MERREKRARRRNKGCYGVWRVHPLPLFSSAASKALARTTNISRSVDRLSNGALWKPSEVELWGSWCSVPKSKTLERPVVLLAPPVGGMYELTQPSTFVQ
jgi:hypothetical protein